MLATKPPNSAQQFSTPQNQSASSWLALRASVLRRAVSLLARPLVTSAAPARSALAAHSPTSHRENFPSSARLLRLHSKGFHCGLTRRLTGPIAAGRHLGYKSLAQIPARRNRPVSLYVRHFPSGISCFCNQPATSSVSGLASPKHWSQSSVQRFPVRHNTTQFTHCLRAVRPSAASELV